MWYYRTKRQDYVPRIKDMSATGPPHTIRNLSALLFSHDVHDLVVSKISARF